MRKIVLIDDDETTNYLNRLIIERSKLVDEVLSFGSAQDALDFFKDPNANNDKALILLDVNMPVMNGWQFLEQYHTLHNQTHQNQIVLLTSSINPDDKRKAEEKEGITDYRSKPLSIEMINELVSSYMN